MEQLQMPEDGEAFDLARACDALGRAGRGEAPPTPAVARLAGRALAGLALVEAGDCREDHWQQARVVLDACEGLLGLPPCTAVELTQAPWTATLPLLRHAACPPLAACAFAVGLLEGRHGADMDLDMELGPEGLAALRTALDRACAAAPAPDGSAAPDSPVPFPHAG